MYGIADLASLSVLAQVTLSCSRFQMHLGIKSMGVSETWFQVDFENVKHFKDSSIRLMLAEIDYYQQN